MRKMGLWVAVGCCWIVMASGAWGQRKAGLWEMSTSMSVPGMPAGMGAHTQQVCVTQAMIDKYGGPTSQPQNSQCQMTNVAVTATGMTATMTCTGRMPMNGTIQTTFVDANTTKTTVQMTSTMPNGQSMNMTMQSTATYKGADCGSVQPLAMPANK